MQHRLGLLQLPHEERAGRVRRARARFRSPALERLAEDMLPILEAQDVHREALAALVLFQDGARREELTVERVRQVAAFLKDARGNPQMRFRTGR